MLAPLLFSPDIKTPVKNRHRDVNRDAVNELAFIGPLKHAGLSLYWSGGMSQCVAAALATAQTEYLYATTGLDVVPMRLIISVLVMAAVLFGVLHIMPEWSQGRCYGVLLLRF